MKTELIPLIEFGYNDFIEIPKGFQSWKYPELFDNYRQQGYHKAGFKDKMIPYLTGYPFYKPSDISDNNLSKLVIDSLSGFGEESCAFFGGYVLKIDGQDKLFPQCCGDLGDINFWEKVSNYEEAHYEGHPAPKIAFENNLVIIDLTRTKYDEDFEPTPPKDVIKISNQSLKMAVNQAKEQLRLLEIRIKKINIEENLNIKNIENILIWCNNDFE